MGSRPLGQRVLDPFNMPPKPDLRIWYWKKKVSFLDIEGNDSDGRVFSHHQLEVLSL